MTSRGAYLKAVLELLVHRPGYVWGGKTNEGCDCSGFATLPLHLAGGPDFRHTHNTDKLWTEFPRIPDGDALVGDVALYGVNPSNPDDVSHCMVYLGLGVVVGMAWGGPADTNAAASRAAGKVPLVRPVRYRDDFRGFIRLPLDVISL